MTLIHTGAAAKLPLSIQEAKALARLDGDDDNALIAGYLRSAVEWCEQYLGLALITSTGSKRQIGFLLGIGRSASRSRRCGLWTRSVTLTSKAMC
jgi:hypothetical protein